jgi:6-phosphogluconate dehydrogenase
LEEDTVAELKTGTGQIAVLGAGTMGASLALNFADHGYKVVLWNKSAPNLDKARKAESGDKLSLVTQDLAEMLRALERPRKILLMVPAGAPVDDMIERLWPSLEAQDIVIDGGNSFYKDTQRRAQKLATAGYHFVGMGVSGGEEGARRGPSIMPGGSRESYEKLRPLLESIAAKTESGPCVTHVGPDGAGHFVKMVHNGIEYADMQLIAEAYALLKAGLGLDAPALGKLFAEWNSGPLGSFLIELTGRVLQVKDPETGKWLVDLVLDKAGAKGTGRWTVESALELGVPVPAIAAALDARLLSSLKDERVAASKLLPPAPEPLSGTERDSLRQNAQEGLLSAKIGAYAQGFRLIQVASEQHKWNVSLEEMARIWKGGCIIRAKLLDSIMQAFRAQPGLKNLMLADAFRKQLSQGQAAWRRAVISGLKLEVALPVFTASLSYFDSYCAAELPQNLTQAQRDAFGAHTYERRDQPGRGFIHTEWLGKP